MTTSLDALNAFQAVYEAGGFTAASGRLGLTTNAVSLRIQKLEQSLGVRLFVRTTRSVAPTDEARRYYARVSRLLTELEQAEAELQHENAGLTGVVKVVLPAALGTEPFFERLRPLLDANPWLSVQPRISNTPVNLIAEAVDIGVTVGRPAESTFIGRSLGRVTWVLAAAPAYLDERGRPRSPQDLTQHRCLRLHSNPPQLEWTLVDQRGRETVVPVRGGLEADDSRALGDATYAGLGIGVRPAGECARAARRGRLERVLPAYRFQPLEVFALIPKGRTKVRRVAACLEVLRSAVEQLG